MSSKIKKIAGFTLIEILVVIALIAILASITIVAINPAKAFADARNTQRAANVSVLLNAITQYTSAQGQSLADFEGTAGNATWDDIATCNDPVTPWTKIYYSSTGTPIATVNGNGTTSNAAASIDFSTKLVPIYVAALPRDPNATTTNDTGYTICKSLASGRITINAPFSETTNGTPKIIQVTR